MRLTKISKSLSLILRHRPETIGLQLDQAGWASIFELIEKAGKSGIRMTPELIRQVVATSDKQRFSISADGTRIRANQGYSIPVDLGLQATVFPELLYHGTAIRNLNAIRQEDGVGVTMFISRRMKLPRARLAGVTDLRLWWQS